jgi:hypothetical protein
MAYGSTEVPPTQFAITTVNVPDRLDLRDMDDRKLEEETRSRRFDTSVFREWAPRLFLVGLVVAIAFVLFEGIDAWRTALSADQLSRRLSTTLGVPVQIGESQFAISPAPELLLSKISIDNTVVLDTISVSIGYRQLGQAFQGRGWNWGEAVVTTKPLTIAQCRILMALLPKVNGAFPKSLSALRFERLEISDQPWLAGTWDVSIRRAKDKDMATVLASQHKQASVLNIELHAAADPGAYTFQLEGRNWTPPFGVSIPMEEAVASGQISPTSVEVSQFSVGGPFGSATGQVTASLGNAWSLTGTAKSEGIDLDALIRLISPAPAGDNNDAAAPTVIQGTATFAGQFKGTGASLVDAVAASNFEAPVAVRAATLTGINLGYAAVRPTLAGVTSGGSTRFSTLDANLIASGSQIVFRDIHAHAGALAASGEVEMLPDHALKGHLRVDLGETRVLAPIRVAVRGSVSKPEFGR